MKVGIALVVVIAVFVRLLPRLLLPAASPRSLPCWGYGIRYSYGMFKQHIENPGMGGTHESDTLGYESFSPSLLFI